MADRLPEPRAMPLPEAAAERASATPHRAQLREPRLQPRPSGAVPRTLREQQAWLLEAITAPEPRDPRGLVRGSSRLTAAERVQIYRYAYRARLVEVLRDDYPVLAESLGEEAFEQLCHVYIERQPSRSSNLNHYGTHMAALCAQSERPERAFLSELAALEWALVEVIHAEAGALELEALQRVPAEAWAGARLVPSDALRLLRFTHPVNAYYQACRTRERGAPLPPPPAAGASATAIYRRGPTVWRMDLTPAMTRVLEALIAQRSIAEALAQIGVNQDELAEAERSVMTWFRSWVSGGFFASVITG
jgi:hypothetical protein